MTKAQWEAKFGGGQRVRKEGWDPGHWIIFDYFDDDGDIVGFDERGEDANVFIDGYGPSGRWEKYEEPMECPIYLGDKPEKTKVVSIDAGLIDEAKTLIQGTRHGEHGSFADNVTKLGNLMTALTDKTYSRHELRSFFIALKLCRRPENHFGKDSLTDLIGYVQLAYNDQELHKGEKDV